MPCAGCIRRRKKMAAAVVAVKYGIETVKRIYKVQTQTPGQQRKKLAAERARDMKDIPAHLRPVDIRK